jgi:DHA2 family multidrug resistance protein-like MFS transporter
MRRLKPSDAQQLGIALGSPSSGGSGAGVYRSQKAGTPLVGIPAGAAHAARDTLAGAEASAAICPLDLERRCFDAAREFFTTALNVVALFRAIPSSDSA